MLIKNSRVICPVSGIDDILDVLIEDGKIKAVEKKIIPDASRSIEIVEAQGFVLVPGLIDMHTHLREPGYEYKETIESGSMAAAAGGFTGIACMANTNPVNDNAAVTEFIRKKALVKACVNVYPVGAVTKGLMGESLSEMGELKETGIVAVSDDGKTVKNPQVMRRALEYAKSFSLPVICHCEDTDLSGYGVMNEGKISTLLGLTGIPSAAEEIMVARDISLAALTGHPVHIAHVSTAGSVHIIREAKSKGIKITAETAPHYFSLTDEAVSGFDTAAKVNPPLATQSDVEEIIKGLKDGTIDVIASDHAPHSSLEKDLEFQNAAFGMVGLETALPLSLRLVFNNTLTLPELIKKMASNPARILKLDKGTLTPGSDADVTIIDPVSEFTVDRELFKSKSRNTPFHGWNLKGRAVYTIVFGKIVFKN